MGRVLPILFNTNMVIAILEGRKTVTRRVADKIPAETYRIERKLTMELSEQFSWKTFECYFGGYQQDTGCFAEGTCIVRPPCQPGDILYVRETWQKCEWGYLYKACPKGLHQPGTYTGMPWRPSIHMPKEAARIWLKVRDVKMERLQDIMEDPPGPKNQVVKEGCKYGCDFIAVWENTIRKSQRDIYGWNANPWVWVIEFERCEKPETVN